METLDDIKKAYQGQSYDQLLAEIGALRAEVDQLRHIAFNKKSERFKAQFTGPSLFDEAEQIAHENPREEDSNDTIDVKGFKRKRGGRKKLPENLERERIEHDLPEDQKLCSKHDIPLVKVGEKVSEKLEIIPAKMKVIENVTFAYKCPCCSEQADNDSLVSSKVEGDLIPKSMATPSLLAYIATAKYQDALPLARQEKIFARYDIDLNRTTMARWMISVGEQLTPLLNLMREDLLAKPVVGCDETPTQVLKEPDRPPDRRSHMWIMRSFDEHPIILFQYQEGRSAKAADKVLGGYDGVVVCDGLKSYEAWARLQGAILAACMAHIRRKFDQARKAAKKAAPKATPKAVEPLQLIQKLYRIEAELAGKTFEEIRATREEHAAPVMAELESWLERHVGQVLPKSLLGKAITYARNQWAKMKVFLTNPQVPIDNNPTEQAIKPFATGRKNWYFACTPQGAHASAAIYSLVESAKANQIEPFSYLLTVFKELPQASKLEDFERLLPNKIGQHFDLKTYTPRK